MEVWGWFNGGAEGSMEELIPSQFDESDAEGYASHGSGVALVAKPLVEFQVELTTSATGKGWCYGGPT